MSADRGSATVETAVIVPVAMVVVMLVVQMCLWAHAGTLVQGAANVGDQAATSLGGSPATGVVEARQELIATGREVVTAPSVQVQQLSGGQVEVTVSGDAESIIPWLHLPVSATRIGVSQEFRESG
jgi:TadE-like protein